MQGASSPIGRRDLYSDKRSGNRVVCSHCCSVNPINGLECNARMCGIKSCKYSLPKYGVVPKKKQASLQHRERSGSVVE